jgi:hypothetical protein
MQSSSVFAPGLRFLHLWIILSLLISSGGSFQASAQAAAESPGQVVVATAPVQAAVDAATAASPAAEAQTAPTGSPSLSRPLQPCYSHRHRPATRPARHRLG